VAEKQAVGGVRFYLIGFGRLVFGFAAGVVAVAGRVDVGAKKQPAAIGRPEWKTRVLRTRKLCDARGANAFYEALRL